MESYIRNEVDSEQSKAILYKIEKLLQQAAEKLEPIIVSNTGQLACINTEETENVAIYTIINQIRSLNNMKLTNLINAHFTRDILRRSNFAFMIEGVGYEHPEIVAAETLAHAIHSLIFDPVNSATSEAIDNSYKAINTNALIGEQRKDFALLTIQEFNSLSFRTSWLAMENLAKKTYADLFLKKGENLPEWISQIRADRLDELVAYFKISENDLNAIKNKFRSLTDNANINIPDRIYDFLLKRPHVETLIGLWGRYHLSAFDKYKHPEFTVIEQQKKENNCHIELILSKNNRRVNIHLFGSSHGFLQGYQQLEIYAKEKAWIANSYNPPIGYLQRSNSDEPNHQYFNVTWGRMGLLYQSGFDLLGNKIPSIYIARQFLFERLYGFFGFNHWANGLSSQISWNLLHEISDSVSDKLDEFHYLTEDQKNSIISQIENLFCSSKEETIINDINIMTELVTGLQLYPTCHRSELIHETLKSSFSLSEQSDLPLSENVTTRSTKLIQEYAGIITSSQMLFFKPKTKIPPIKNQLNRPNTITQFGNSGVK